MAKNDFYFPPSFALTLERERRNWVPKWANREALLAVNEKMWVAGVAAPLLGRLLSSKNELKSLNEAGSPIQMKRERLAAYFTSQKPVNANMRWETAFPQPISVQWASERLPAHHMSLYSLVNHASP